jgi:molecular chaperone DnaK
MRHLGIDLGTTNSSAAVHDGERVELVRNRAGGPLTPSVVRIDARGNVLVGDRARRFLDSDTANTRSEFKRLMGSVEPIAFPACGRSLLPHELAAEVLKSLIQDVSDQTGTKPDQAVVTVPALFELPQIAATADAARVAGLERIEVLQEPVASALAAGWTAADVGQHWLVYDLGGGTFDVSLLETREGILRVVGHDGDNFLGGRDFDRVLVDEALRRLAATGVVIDRADPRHELGMRRLRHAAEEAKIELTRAREALVQVAGAFEAGAKTIDVEEWIERHQFDEAITPLVDRSLAVVRRLLGRHGIVPGDLHRVVLVGGPTVIPRLRERLHDVIGAPIADGLDPMTVVAQGAALYAATVRLEMRAAPVVAAVRQPRVWLQYPAVTGDMTPYVVGRLLDPKAFPTIRLDRTDATWRSEPVEVGADGSFAVIAALLPRTTTMFRLVGVAGTRDEPLDEIRILHGLTLTDPPLSRSIGVALADGRVHVYFERGSPLPMRRSFVHRTIATVARGADEMALRVPIVQGEFPFAHLCRLVGTIEISGRDVTATLPAGSDVEVGLELDRGGRLTARAFVPSLRQSFEQIAHLVVPKLDLGSLAEALAEIHARVGTLQVSAFRQADGAAVARATEIRALLEDADVNLQLARGGDADAGEKARRAIQDADAALAEDEASTAWPTALQDLRRRVSIAASWVALYGEPHERKVFGDGVDRMAQLIQARNALDASRQADLLHELGVAAYLRNPDAWAEQLAYAAGRMSEASDLVAAERAVAAGRDAERRQDIKALERAVRDLWKLLPPDVEERQRSHDSGVR